MNSKWVAVLLLLAAPGVGACGVASIVPPTVSVPNDEPVEGGVVEGQATVESIEVVTVESFPVQVLVIVRGNLPDGCTQLGDPVVQVAGSTFMMTLPTSRQQMPRAQELRITWTVVKPAGGGFHPSGQVESM